MEAIENSDKPAYPTNARMHSDAQGLTKRELFAMAAMQGIISNRELQKDLLKDAGNGVYPARIRSLNEIAAFEAIGFADELLEQLNKTPE